jgi:hypothetical protein
MRWTCSKCGSIRETEPQVKASMCVACGTWRVGQEDVTEILARPTQWTEYVPVDPRGQWSSDVILQPTERVGPKIIIEEQPLVHHLFNKPGEAN